MLRAGGLKIAMHFDSDPLGDQIRYALRKDRLCGDPGAGRSWRTTSDDPQSGAQRTADRQALRGGGADQTVAGRITGAPMSKIERVQGTSDLLPKADLTGAFRSG
jgi:hypothetical protein